MTTIRDRLEGLIKWCGEPTNRNYKAARHLSAKAGSFPFSIIRHGVSPCKDEYLARYTVVGKHPFRCMVNAYIIERPEGEANPRILFERKCTQVRNGLEVSYQHLTLKPHALDRYSERHLKKPKGYSLTLNELSGLLFAQHSMIMSVNPITGELQLKMDVGLFLGEAQKGGDWVINTFVADHNLFPNQSMEKRNMKEYQCGMDEIYGQLIQTKEGFNMVKDIADRARRLPASTLSSTIKG